MQNASVAIKAVELINEHWPKSESAHHKSFITHHIIRKGLQKVRWPGRLEFVNEAPPILIDGAHNPSAASALSEALKRSFLEKYKKIILILGIMGDKDVKGVMEPLLPLASEIILTSPSYSRAASPEKLADIAASLGFSDVLTSATVKDAIEMAINHAIPPSEKVGKGDLKKEGTGKLAAHRSSLLQAHFTQQVKLKKCLGIRVC